MYKSITSSIGVSMTPEFQGTHLWDRLGWAKENLEPYRSEYCIVWEDPDNLDEPAKVTHPDPNWMACALNGHTTTCMGLLGTQEGRSTTRLCKTYKRILVA